jgi:endonuclease YncB( thermonuclease family)
MAAPFSILEQWRQFRPTLATLFLLAILSMPAIAEPIDPSDIRVIDGDTIRVYHQQPNVRLVGFNAPETRNAECPGELELGSRATRRLRDIIRAGNFDFTYIKCSCPEATQGTFACNYGRDCGTLKSNGRDVGAILIEEDLAVPFVCGPTHCPKTPRPWCAQQPN